MTHERIRLGISACLLGELVRFDGGHKRDPWNRWDSSSTGCRCPHRWSLGWTRRVNRCGWCRRPDSLLTNRTAHDHTARMHGYARRHVERTGRRRAGRLRVEEGFTSRIHVDGSSGIAATTWAAEPLPTPGIRRWRAIARHVASHGNVGEAGPESVATHRSSGRQRTPELRDFAPAPPTAKVASASLGARHPSPRERGATSCP